MDEEDVLQKAVFYPSGSVDELGCDSELISTSSDAPFQNVLDTQFPAVVIA